MFPGRFSCGGKTCPEYGEYHLTQNERAKEDRMLSAFIHVSRFCGWLRSDHLAHTTQMQSQLNGSRHVTQQVAIMTEDCAFQNSKRKDLKVFTITK